MGGLRVVHVCGALRVHANLLPGVGLVLLLLLRHLHLSGSSAHELLLQHLLLLLLRHAARESGLLVHLRLS